MPPKPITICDRCWKGPFAAHLGLYSEPIGDRPLLDDDEPGPVPGGYSYFTSWAELESGTHAGCSWCRIISATRSDQGADMDPDSPLRIVIGRLMLGLSGTDDMTPKGTQYLTVWVNDELYFEGYAYTTPGEFSHTKCIRTWYLIRRQTIRRRRISLAETRFWK